MNVIRDRVQRMLRRDRIRHKLITQAEIQRQCSAYLPVVMDIPGQVDLTEVPVSVALRGQRTKEQERGGVQEVRHRVENILTTQPSRRVHVRLHAFKDTAELDVVVSVSP